MSKTIFIYDKETLSYKKVRKSWRKRTQNYLLFLGTAALFGLSIFVLLYHFDFMYSPREVEQKREIKQYQTQYAILNKKLEQLEIVLKNVVDRDEELYRAYFELSPIPPEQRNKGLGGLNRYEYLQGQSNSELLISTTQRLEKLQRQLAIQSQSLDEITKFVKEKEKLLAAIPAIQPVQNKHLTRIASGYGWRNDPFTKAKKFHYGMDFTAPTGTPIYATGDGIITRADNKSSGYGHHIRIDHGFGYESLYAHLSRYNVRVGQRIKRGEVIGFVGNTGRSEAPHLHYEIKKDGQHLNPINFYYGNLTPEEYAIMLEQSTKENQSLD